MPPRQPAPKPPHKMEFATNSLRNTTLAAGDDVLYYEIVTRYWHPNVTRVVKHDFEARTLVPVAEIEDLFQREPRVRFIGPDGAEGEWVDAGQLVAFDEQHGGTFTIGEGAEYRWRVHKGSLQLVRADDPEKTFADFHPPKRHFGVWRMSHRAFFEIKPESEVMHALEKFIVTYLLVERRRRDARIGLKLRLGRRRVPKPVH
ncbi:hypothetical protein SCP_0300020 [Sparassis crispa]|uniref:DUF6593 domain-containing protein n=1 Tax=Sparassis crispa TaxID=139825 RepID=A0A401GDP5_9APHY|nr:hypothetical protein SCP_0300020 [Sparassis crispa]GBE80287.1 hypothetical protein SCP_0300020 [Sparassis crispa]